MKPTTFLTKLIVHFLAKRKYNLNNILNTPFKIYKCIVNVTFVLRVTKEQK